MKHCGLITVYLKKACIFESIDLLSSAIILCKNISFYLSTDVKAEKLRKIGTSYLIILSDYFYWVEILTVEEKKKKMFRAMVEERVEGTGNTSRGSTSSIINELESHEHRG